jgi:Flp pilus assembly protein TadG
MTGLDWAGGRAMRHRQRGVTFIGWLILLLPLAIVGYAAIRLTPVYLNYVKVARSLEQAAVDFQDDKSVTAAQIRNSIDKRFDVESVNYPRAQDIRIQRDGQKWVLHAAYEDVAPLFSNVSLLVSFDRKVELR